MKNNQTLLNTLSIPFIWGCLFPVLLLHLFIFIYQSVAFRLYGIERIQLRSYLNFDREKLDYLRWGDKLNCAYCSYVNGFLTYASEIGHRTEYYWCGIKHRNQLNNPAFAYQEKFACYGSKEDFERVLVKSGRNRSK
jgi:hypothetical protein